jgi:hypothetical protein
MHIIILNWTEGENDPFTFFSTMWQRCLEAEGHDVRIVPLDVRTILTIAELHTEHAIDLAFCWQGLGSALVPDGFTQTLWELLRIPLVCLHGDHPSYNPANHQQSSAFLLHLYGEPIFADAANSGIPREWPALFGILPNIFGDDDPFSEFTGDYFVLAKNIQDLESIRDEWKVRCDQRSYTLLCETASAIAAAYFDGNRVNHHEVIVAHLPVDIRNQIRSGTPSMEAVDFHFRFSREVDRIHRNVAATFIVDTLADVPLRIYGRGWDRFKARGNPRHEFRPAQTVQQSGDQYRSQFGILDVASSNDLLHDRTFRALHHGAGFLISSAWQRGTPIHEEFSDLFFGGVADELIRKVDLVQRNPAAHRLRCAAFAAQIRSAPRATAAFLMEIESQLALRSIR